MQQHDRDDKYRDKFYSYFNDSDILNESAPIYRALLYFNLPYDTIISQMWKPKLIFSYEKAQIGSEKLELNNIFNEFEISNEQFQKGKKSDVAPNIILMKVDTNGEIHNETSKTYIIGGYASHRWSRNGSNGDKSCFLFNLTQNLRFNARESMPYYQSSDGQFLKFGNTDLVFADGLHTVTSQIQPPTTFEGALGGDRRGVEHRQMSGSHFSFGNDLT